MRVIWSLAGSPVKNQGTPLITASEALQECAHSRHYERWCSRVPWLSWSKPLCPRRAAAAFVGT